MVVWVVVTVYFVVGCGAAATLVAGHRREGTFAGGLGAGLMVFLWPFLLPVAFFAEVSPRTGTDRAARLDRLARQLKDVWADDDRGAALVDRYVARLERTEARRYQVESAIDTAADSIRERLVQLERKQASQIDEGLVLLDEMVAQLTLLQFSQGIDVGTEERAGVEDLLARMEALASLQEVDQIGSQ